MKRKSLITLALTVGLSVLSVFSSFADVTAAIDLSAYDSSSQEFRPKIYYNHYDAESDLIPILLNNRVIGGLSEDVDISSLIFINRKGETVIPANTNWTLVAGFRHGVALVKDKTTGVVSRIDTLGNILGNIDIEENNIRVLPLDSQYSYYYIEGNGGRYNTPNDDFCIVFISSSGEQKRINLKELGFHYVNYFDKNGRAALSKGKYIGKTTFYMDGEMEIGKSNKYELEETSYIDINGNIIDDVITDHAEEYGKDNISIKQRGINIKKSYECDVYTLKLLEEPYYLGYEIYQNDIPTGVFVYDVIAADNHTIIGHELVERIFDNGNHYYTAGRLMMYHIY